MKNTRITNALNSFKGDKLLPEQRGIRPRGKVILTAYDKKDDRKNVKKIIEQTLKENL